MIDDTAARLSEMEAFAKTEFTPLLPKIQRTRAAILRGYINAGKPYGKGVEQANKWFDEKYAAWRNAQQVDVQQEFQQAEDELLQVGDIERVGDSIRPTAKGYARTIVFTLLRAINLADMDERGLTDDDVMAMQHLLAIVLSDLGSRKVVAA